MVNGNNNGNGNGNGNRVRRKAEAFGERVGRGIRSTFFPTQEQKLDKLMQQQKLLMEEREVAQERLKVAKIRGEIAKARREAATDSPLGRIAGAFAPARPVRPTVVRRRAPVTRVVRKRKARMVRRRARRGRAPRVRRESPRQDMLDSLFGGGGI